MVCTRCSSLTTVAVFLSLYFECPLNTMRQRLREFYWEANAKAGQHRQALDVGTCFAPLLRWALQGWPNRQLPIALDASTLGEKFVVLAISVVYRSCAIPVAWYVIECLFRVAWMECWSVSPKVTALAPSGLGGPPCPASSHICFPRGAEKVS